MNAVAVLILIMLFIFFLIDPCLAVTMVGIAILSYGFVKSE